MLREPIVRVLFQGGAFRSIDTQATAGVLATLSAGLFFFAVVRVVVPAFYALKDTRLPVIAALADCAVFLLGCFTLVPIYGLPGDRAVGVSGGGASTSRSSSACFAGVRGGFAAARFSDPSRGSRSRRPSWAPRSGRGSAPSIPRAAAG